MPAQLGNARSGNHRWGRAGLWHGDTIWVNRPDNAKDLDDDEILVTKTTGSQLCRLDIVQTMDRTSHFTTGFVGLGDFVPYKKVAKAN